MNGNVTVRDARSNGDVVIIPPAAYEEGGSMTEVDLGTNPIQDEFLVLILGETAEADTEVILYERDHVSQPLVPVFTFNQIVATGVPQVIRKPFKRKHRLLTASLGATFAAPVNVTLLLQR